MSFFTWMRAKFPIIIFHMSLAVSIWPILAWKREQSTLRSTQCSVSTSMCVWVWVAGLLFVAFSAHQNNNMPVLRTKMLWSLPHTLANGTYLICFLAHTLAHALRVSCSSGCGYSGPLFIQSYDPKARPQWEDTNRGAALFLCIYICIGKENIWAHRTHKALCWTKLHTFNWEVNLG